VTNVLLTGGTGFIGRQLLKKLDHEGYDTYCLVRDDSFVVDMPDMEAVKGDLTDPSTLRKAIGKVRPDIVVHLAALTPVRFSFQREVEYANVNYLGTVNLVKTLLDEKTKLGLFIHASTAEIYRAKNRLITEEDPVLGLTPYAISKAAADSYVQMAGLAYGLPYTIMRPTNCYSEDTLVLTEDGWKHHSEWNGERIMVYDPATDSMRLEAPLEFVQMPYRGKMIHIKSDSTDILVTPNHRMLINTQDRDGKRERRKFTCRPVLTPSGYRVVEAGELLDGLSEWKMKVAATWSGEPTEVTWSIPSHARFGPRSVRADLTKMMRLLGYYLSEGSAHDHSLRIAQDVASSHIPEIRAVLGGLPFTVSETLHTKKRFGNASTIMVWSLGGLSFHDWAIEMCGRGAYGKCISPTLKNLGSEYLLPLFESMMDGDGAWNQGKKSGCYWTVSMKLAYDFAEVVMKLGYAFKIGCVKQRNPLSKGLLYRVGICKRDTRYFSKRKRTSRVEAVDYDGPVFCFRTSTGFYVTMRNGLPAIQGNTYGRPFELPEEARGYLVEKAIIQMLTRPVVEFDGYPKPRRCWMYGDDHVDAYLSVLDRPKAVGQIFNASPNDPKSVGQIVSLIAQEVGFEGEVKWGLAPRPYDPPSLCLDGRKLTQYTGWKPKYTLEEGVKRTVQYWRHLL